MLLVNKHPSVKAIAPRFALYDVYSDIGEFVDCSKKQHQKKTRFLHGLMSKTQIAFPGGIPLTGFLRNWTSFNAALDKNDLQSKLGSPADLFITGVSSVDGNIEELNKVVKSREPGWNPIDLALKHQFRGDAATFDNGRSIVIDENSPHRYKKEIEESGAAIYSYSGWFDGAYQNAAIKRFVSLSRTTNSQLCNATFVSCCCCCC